MLLSGNGTLTMSKQFCLFPWHDISPINAFVDSEHRENNLILTIFLEDAAANKTYEENFSYLIMRKRRQVQGVRRIRYLGREDEARDWRTRVGGGGQCGQRKDASRAENGN